MSNDAELFRLIFGTAATHLRRERPDTWRAGSTERETTPHGEILEPTQLGAESSPVEVIGTYAGLLITRIFELSPGGRVARALAPILRKAAVAYLDNEQARAFADALDRLDPRNRLAPPRGPSFD